MYQLKTPEQLASMRRAGLVVWLALHEAGRHVRPGVATAELDQVIRDVFRRCGAEPLFQGRSGRVPFPAASCVSVNEEVVHGVPGPRRLKPGDLLTIDTGCRLDGWCADAAVLLSVGSLSPRVEQLAQAARTTLQLAIDRMGRAARWAEVARAMAAHVRRRGFSLVEGYVGHGIGRRLHERPDVPNHPAQLARTGADFPLEPGLVLAIEPMVALGDKQVRVREDGWTVVTADGLPAAHVEHTVALTGEGPRVLTGPPDQQERDWLRRFGFTV